MKDITSIGTDLTVLDAQVAKARNLFEVQLGALSYLPDFGIDLAFFLDPNLQFQNDSFKSYLIQRLSENHISANEVLEALTTFTLDYTFVVGAESQENTAGGLIK